MPVEGGRFGPYALLEKLGEGGMGEVWKAMDTRLERVVALKLMKGEDESVRKALIREAKTASQLTHPNIAVIFEAGEEEGVPFIAMEYVEGQTLAERLGTRSSEAEILAIARQAGAALLHAHQKGVVHRDIKPDNLVLTGGGHLEILDFGIAKRAVGAEPGASAPTVVHLTQPGVSMGTPAYMSPEQAYGRAVGPASDQFSLGVVLRELATGERTFKRETMLETLHAVVKDDPWRLADLRPDLSPALCETLDRMIRKEPAERFPDLDAFLAALPDGSAAVAPAPLPRQVLPAAEVPQPPSRRSWRLALGLGALLVACGFLAWRLWEPKAPEPPGRRVVALLPVHLEPTDPARSWIGTSLADAMNTSLLRRGDLRVLDRPWVAEAARRKGWTPEAGPEALVALGRELKADWLVVGECGMEGERLVVRMTLKDAAQGRSMGDFKVEGSVPGLLLLEDALATKLPAMMGLEAAPSAGSGGPAPDAHQKAKNLRTRELHARALELADRGNLDAYDAARTLFREAIELEPGYAPAHAGLAWALQDMGATEAHLGRQDSALLRFKEAEASARKALALDPRSTLALRALGGALIRQSRFAEARLAAAKAVALDPVDHHALVGLADTYAYGDLPADRAKARQFYGQAVEIAPAYWYGHFRYAVLLQNEGDLEASVKEADLASSLQPSAEYSYLTAGLSLLWLGQPDAARGRLEAGLQQVPASKLLKLTLALAAHAMRDAGTYHRLKEDLATAWPPGHIIAILLDGLGADLDGHPAQSRTAFLGEARKARKSQWESRPASDRRGASVNLYHMARALALRKDPAAQEILAVSEALNPGKARVAAKDPAFQGLSAK
ncbi:MAG: protein kinase [Holophagaceae bacterium]|nr:protein kinase [Holophagaceae bacterium]